MPSSNNASHDEASMKERTMHVLRVSTARRLALACLLAASLLGCRERGAPQRGEKLETIEVGGGLGEGISLEGDVQAKPPGERVAGVVPSDFPEDFPVYSPSTVVDFGPGFVLLTSSDPVGTVASRLAASAAAAGWRDEGGGRFRQGGRRVEAMLSETSGVTHLRLEYTGG